MFLKRVISDTGYQIRAGLAAQKVTVNYVKHFVDNPEGSSPEPIGIHLKLELVLGVDEAAGGSSYHRPPAPTEKCSITTLSDH